MLKRCLKISPKVAQKLKIAKVRKIEEQQADCTSKKPVVSVQLEFLEDLTLAITLDSVVVLSLATAVT